MQDDVFSGHLPDAWKDELMIHTSPEEDEFGLDSTASDALNSLTPEARCRVLKDMES